MILTSKGERFKKKKRKNPMEFMKKAELIIFMSRKTVKKTPEIFSDRTSLRKFTHQRRSEHMLANPCLRIVLLMA